MIRQPPKLVESLKSLELWLLDLYRSFFHFDPIITGGTIDNAAIGSITPSTGDFTDISTTDATGGYIALRRNDNTVVNTDYIGVIAWLANDTDTQGGVYEPVADITVSAIEDFDDFNDGGVRMGFWVNPVGQDTPSLEMTLTGDVLGIDHIGELTGGHGITFNHAIHTTVNPYIKYSLSGTTLTLTVIGPLIINFPKQGTIGDIQPLDLTGMSWSFNPAAYPDSMMCGIVNQNWSYKMPWFDYLVNKDNTALGVSWGCSRNPTLSTIPAHGSINFSDALASDAQAQTGFVSGTAHDASFGAYPCVGIGSHTQTYSYGGVGAREWVIGALATTDGYNLFQYETVFTYPRGQYVANSYIVTNGGTEPTDATDTEDYMIDRSGWFTLIRKTAKSAGGVGANTVTFGMPYNLANLNYIQGIAYTGDGDNWGVVPTGVDQFGLTKIRTAAPMLNTTFDDATLHFVIRGKAF